MFAFLANNGRPSVAGCQGLGRAGTKREQGGRPEAP